MIWRRGGSAACSAFNHLRGPAESPVNPLKDKSEFEVAESMSDVLSA